jgi:hypothetical protein
MKSFFNLRAITALLLIFCALHLCQCSDDPKYNATDLANARLTDFPLFEIEYLSIDIVHPVIANGIEASHGTIEITIPHSQQSLMLSLKEFNVEHYNISPSIGVQQDFSVGPVVYTLSSQTSLDRSVHYDVTISHSGPPWFTNKEITGFKFEKSKNPQLAETIDALKIAEYENGSENGIYVIFPVGTDFTNLTPTITFDAAKLYYNNDTHFMPYPENGLTVDFKYPKHFFLQVENSLGEKSLVYNVIVDVKNPIRFDPPVLHTPDVEVGDNFEFENFFALVEWTNQGNHPVTGMSPINYTDRVFPAGFPEELTVITTSLVNPGASPGVLPGQKGNVHVKVRKTSLPGVYSTKANFLPTFSFNTRVISFWPVEDRVEGIFDLQSLMIETEIVE